MARIGETISHYRITEHLGGGGMGVVYRAEDLRLGRPVALKCLPPELTRDRDAERRFEQEARAASAIDHPNICTIHDIDQTEPSGEHPDRRLFIVMAFYEGATLKYRIEDGPLPVDASVNVAMQIAQRLQAAHEVGIVHRDIKPADVMVVGRGRVKLLDFGVA